MKKLMFKKTNEKYLKHMLVTLDEGDHCIKV